jgi:hypothetical protein
MAQEEGRRARRRSKNAPSYDQVKAGIDAKEKAAAERKAERAAARKPLTPGERYEQEKAARGKKYSSDVNPYFNPRSVREEVLSYLLDEGFASDEKSAEAIMGAMSEEWVGSIVEGGIPNLNLPWNKKSSGTAQGDFEAGGGLTKMKKSGMNRDEVITQGQRNIHNNPLTGTLSPTRFASDRSTDTGRKMNDYYKRAGVKFPEDSK